MVKFLMLVLFVIPAWGGTQLLPINGKTKDSTFISDISTIELAKQFNKVVIIDVRSSFEYKVIHIQGAFNVPVAHINFISDLKTTLKHKKDIAVAFYCNGIKCGKALRAANLAHNNGFSQIYIYKKGVFEWTDQYPERTSLMGKIPARSENIISMLQFKSHLLKPKKFLRAVKKDSKAFLIDIRDAIQKQHTPNFGVKISNFTQDHLSKLLALKSFQKHTKDKNFYIFDNVGAQVRWLQYYLKKYGKQNYYFLEGGIDNLISQSKVKRRLEQK
ncbi:MAG: rhodanese-like domain-containing protein [Pseudomonadota bacterium]